MSKHKIVNSKTGSSIEGRVASVSTGSGGGMYQYWDVVLGFKTHGDTLTIGRVDADTEIKACELAMVRFRRFFQLLDADDSVFVIKVKCIG